MLRMPWAPKSAIANARTWLRYNLGAWRVRQRPNYLAVRYEELVTRPERELSRICAHVGEEYSPAMLVPNRDPAVRADWFRRAEEPVTTERLGKWREELTPSQVALVESAVGSYMETFGYEAVGGRAPRWRALGDAAAGAYGFVMMRVAQFPASWYYLTASANLAREEAAREQYQKPGWRSRLLA
jgi:hypothetical protein